MQFTVEIPVRVSKSASNGLERTSYMEIEVRARDEYHAVKIVAGRIQHLLNDEVDLSW